MPPLKSIMLWKRNGGHAAALKTQMDNAVACLAKSVGSIIDDDSVDKNAMLAKTFVQFLAHCNGLTKRKTSPQAVVDLHKIFGVAKNDSERAEPDLSDSDAGMPRRRRRRDDEAARVAAEMDTDTDHDRRDDDDKKETNMTEKSHSLSNIVKRHGFVALAKAVNAGSVALTETEYTQALVADCARRGVSFEKAFCDNTSEGLEIRKGRERCRDTAFAKAGAGLMPLMPTQTNSLAAARNVNADEPDAYKKLVAMAEKMRATSPEMTLAQAFERTYTSPEAKALAALERRQAHNRLPTTGGFGSGTLMPMQVDKAERDVDSGEGGGEHYEKLMVLAEQAHAAQPEKSVAQHFAKIYNSREHRGLAEAERLENRPRA